MAGDRFLCGPRDPSPADRHVVDQFAALLAGDRHALLELQPPRAWHLVVERHRDEDGDVDSLRGYAHDEVFEVVAFDWPNWTVTVRQRVARGRYGTTVLRMDRIWLDHVHPGPDGIDLLDPRGT